MDKLTKYLIDSILKEDTKIKKIVGVYGGRFQPFGPHHLKTFKWLEKQVDEAYITTSNIKKPPRHPMDFKEKVRHMSKMGVKANKISFEKSPFVAKNLAKKYDSETTAFVYVFGAKDTGRLGGGKYFQDYLKNKDNLQGHEEHGYYLVAPHISISVGGEEVSGTSMRTLLGSPKIDDSDREKLFKKMFGYFNDGIYQMMSNKFKKLFEISEYLSPKTPITEIELKNVLSKLKIPKTFWGDNRKLISYFQTNPQVLMHFLKLVTEEQVNEDWFKKGSKKDRAIKLQISKLYSKAFKLMPGSPNQEKIKKEIEKLRNQLNEYDIPIKVGDTVLMGKFKNKKVVVKSIDINDKGDMVINGKSASKFRLIKQPNIFDENLEESSTNAGYSADAGEPDTGYTSPGKKRTIGKGAQPDNWYRKGGYEQLEFPKADDPYGDDANRRISIQKIVNPDIYIDTIESDDYITSGVDEKGDNFVQALTDNVILDFLSTINLKKLIKEANTTKVSIGGNSQGVDDGPSGFYGNKKTYLKKNELLAGKMGWKVIRLLVGEDTPEIYAFNPDTDYPNGPVGDVSFAPSGYTKFEKERGEREDLVGKEAYTQYVTHINNVAKVLGYEILDYLGAELVSKHSLGQKEISKEKPGETDDDRNKKEFKGQKVEESLFSKKWWKNKLLFEGGAYGHMAHPFDDKDLKFADLKYIIVYGLGGQLNREDGVTEKLDGQNLMVSWIDGKLRIARNKGHIKNFGKTSLDASGIKSKFKGRGEIADAFNFAVKDLEKAIKSLSGKQQDKIFDSGKNWMNLEVMWPASANVIDYDVANIVFHGALIYDDKGNVRGEVKGSARILAGMIQQVNQHIQKKYSIGKPNFLDVPKHQDFNSLVPKFLSRLDKLKHQYGLSDSDTLGMYHQSYWEEYIFNAAKQFGYEIPDSILINLTKRWAFFDKSYKISTIKADLKDESEFLDWVLTTDKNDHSAMAKENIKPFEILFFDLGAQILKNVQGYIAVSPDKAVQSMRKGLSKAISDVESGGDVKKLNKLKAQLEKLESIGGMDAIVPSEGIVFKYKGNTYKFTGAFAPINQIMGLITF